MVPKMGKMVPRMGKKEARKSRTLCDGLFSKTRQAVLALLYGQTDKSFYTRQILDSVGAGRGTVQRELRRLTDAGLITRQVRGRQVYYQANRRCPIFNELKSIVRKTFGVADVIRRALAPVAGRVRAAFIFGSTARGTDVRESDIDLMVVGAVSFGDIVDLLSDAEEKLGREINAVVYPESEFRQKVEENQYFVKTVLQGEKIFLIGDEDELRKLAGRR